MAEGAGAVSVEHAQMLEARCTADEIAVLLAVIAELRRAQGLPEPGG